MLYFFSPSYSCSLNEYCFVLFGFPFFLEKLISIVPFCHLFFSHHSYLQLFFFNEITIKQLEEQIEKKISTKQRKFNVERTNTHTHTHTHNHKNKRTCCVFPLFPFVRRHSTKEKEILFRNCVIQVLFI